MVRIEIFVNRSIQDDLFERLKAAKVLKHYSLIPETHGVGATGPRRGDHIWPEENLILIAYVEEDEARQVNAIINELRERFPDEGIALFAVPTLSLTE